MLEVHSTKAFLNLACAHAQWFDRNEDGSPGHCASIHGYDRAVKLTFSGEVDDNGWLVAFGKLKEVKSWLEYYFDHTTVLPSDDTRSLDIYNDSLTNKDSLFATLRILPYGVSMEMSSLFIWEHVNPYIKHVSDGRAYVSRVESIEHERNSAFITVDRIAALTQARAYRSTWKENVQLCPKYEDYLLPKLSYWDYTSPKVVLNRINGK